MVPPAKTPPKSARRHASTALVASAAAALALSRAARDASSKFSEVSRPVKRPRRDNGRSTGHNQNPGDTAGRIPDPDSGSVDSFERNALGPLLWHRPLEDELQIIPTEFKDDNSYVKAFEPVLLEETREETRNAWCESLGEGRQYRLTFRSLRVVHGSGGWRVATFSVDDRRTLEVIKSLCPEHSVGVLCVEKIAGKDPWPRNKECDGVPLATAGFVEKVSGREKIVEFKFFVSPEVDNQVDCSTAGWKRWHELVRTRERHVLEAFEGTRRTIRGKNSARSVRDARIAAIANETFSKNSSEFLDLTRDDAEDDTEESPKKESGEFPPPPLQKPEGRVWWLSPAGKLSSASQSYEALHHVRRLYVFFVCHQIIDSTFCRVSARIYSRNAVRNTLTTFCSQQQTQTHARRDVTPAELVASQNNRRRTSFPGDRNHEPSRADCVS
jgi:senataxin